MFLYNPNLKFLHKGGSLNLNFSEFLNSSTNPFATVLHKPPPNQTKEQILKEKKLEQEKSTGIISGHGYLKTRTFIIVPDNITISPVVTCGIRAEHRALFSDDNFKNREKFLDKFKRHEISMFQSGYKRKYLPGSLMPEQFFIFNARFTESFFHSGIITKTIPNNFIEYEISNDEKENLYDSAQDFDDYYFETFSFPNKNPGNSELIRKISTKYNNEKILNSKTDYNKEHTLSNILYEISRLIDDDPEIPKKYILLSCRGIDSDTCVEKPNIIYDRYNRYCFEPPAPNSKNLNETRSISEEDFYMNFTKRVTDISSNLDYILNSKIDLNKYEKNINGERFQFSSFIIEHGSNAFNEWKKSLSFAIELQELDRDLSSLGQRVEKLEGGALAEAESDLDQQFNDLVVKCPLLNLIFYIVNNFKQIDIDINYLQITYYFKNMIDGIINKRQTVDYNEACILQHIYKFIERVKTIILPARLNQEIQKLILTTQ